MQLPEHLRAVLAIDPGAPAVEFDDRWWTWGDLSRAADELDAVLDAAGLGPDTGVACLLRTRPEFVAVVLGLVMTRRAVVTVNPQQGDERLVEDLRGMRPPAIVASAEDWDRTALRAVADEVGAVVIAVRPDPLGCDRLGGRRRPAGDRHLVLEPGTAVQMLTSGTTGTPKRVPLSVRSLEEALLGAMHYESGRAATPRLGSGVRVSSSPLVHISGIWDTLTTITAGRRMSLLERFRVEPWVELVRRHRPKALSLVPAALRSVLASPAVTRDDFASVLAVTCGTAPLEPETAIAFEERFGVPVLVLYGATEFSGGVAGWTLDDHRRFMPAKRGSVGRAHPGTELRIVDPDTGAPLPHGADGLLEVRSPQIGLDRGWLRTTDLAVLDDDGFLWIKGRIDDAIIRGGFKVLPAEVQHALESHPAVLEACVVGVADARLGAVPVAAVELVPGARARADELLDYLRPRLTGYQVPVALQVVDALPRTPSLKVSRPAVRALFEEASQDDRSGRGEHRAAR